MKKITVAHITDKATFPGVQIHHIEEIELDNVSGLVFVKDAPFSDNPIPSVDVMMSDGTERRFHIEDIAFIAFPPSLAFDTVPNDTTANVEKSEEYIMDDLVSFILNAYKRKKIKYNEIKDGTVYSFLAGRFPSVPMVFCFNAVMKAWEDILSNDDFIDYEEGK